MCKDNTIYIPLKVTLFEHKTSISADLVVLKAIDHQVDQLCWKGTLHIYFSDSDIAEENKKF